MAKALYRPDGAEAGNSGSVANRISERYGIPPEEVEALLVGKKPIPSGEPHPMTMGAVMKKEQPRELMTSQNNKWHPIVMLGMVLGILGILALGAATILIIKWDGHIATPEIAAKQEMSTPSLPPRAEPAQLPDTTANFVVQDSMTLDQLEALQNEQQKVAKKTPKRRAVTSRHYTTSNSIEAQERLAELRAEGNKRARIQRTQKGGVTMYQVR